MRQRGFTLIEMLVVVAVLGLLAGLVLTRGPARPAGLEVRLAANAVAGSLRAARTQAIATDRSVVIRIDGPAGLLAAGDAAARPMGAVLVPPQRPLLFAPDGSSTGGIVGVVAGRLRRAVAVDWLTGRVSVSDAP